MVHQVKAIDDDSWLRGWRHLGLGSADWRGFGGRKGSSCSVVPCLQVVILHAPLSTRSSLQNCNWHKTLRDAILHQKSCIVSGYSCILMHAFYFICIFIAVHNCFICTQNFTQLLKKYGSEKTCFYCITIRNNTHLLIRRCLAVKINSNDDLNIFGS